MALYMIHMLVFDLKIGVVRAFPQIAWGRVALRFHGFVVLHGLLPPRLESPTFLAGI